MNLEIEFKPLKAYNVMRKFRPVYYILTEIIKNLIKEELL